MKQIGCDPRNLATVEVACSLGSSLGHMHDTDGYGRLPRPFEPSNRAIDGPRVRTDPAQATGPCVSFGDCLCSNQAETSAAPRQREATAKKVGHNVRVATRFLVQA